jgi:prepilin signal peptidase PulO-like enzyme (type II secretory pathway)
VTKKTKIISWISVAFLVFAAACVIAFNLIGSTVDTDGMVQEPFFLLPLAVLFVLTSLITGLIAIFHHLKHKKQSAEK